MKTQRKRLDRPCFLDLFNAREMGKGEGIKKKKGKRGVERTPQQTNRTELKSPL